MALTLSDYLFKLLQQSISESSIKITTESIFNDDNDDDDYFFDKKKKIYSKYELSHDAIDYSVSNKRELEKILKEFEFADSCNVEVTINNERIKRIDLYKTDTKAERAKKIQQIKSLLSKLNPKQYPITIKAAYGYITNIKVNK